MIDKPTLGTKIQDGQSQIQAPKAESDSTILTFAMHKEKIA